MKLWQKVSLGSSLVLLLVVAACGALMMLNARNNIMDIALQQAEDENTNLVNSFSAMAGYYVDDGDTDAVQESTIKYCFERFARSDSVLVGPSGTLVSNIELDPAQMLELDEMTDYAVKQMKYAGGRWLLAGRKTQIDKQPYTIYTVRDITDIYASINSMGWWFAGICAAGMLLGGTLIVVLMRGMSNPLTLLKGTTRQIAAGEFDVRAQVAGKDEVGELAADFNAMADSVQQHIATLEDITERQQLFIGGLTHEFKTPMTSMIIHTDTLLETELDEEQAHKSLEHINRQCRWLERLTKKLLQLITVEDDIKLKPQEIGGLLKDVAASVAQTLEARETPLMIEGNDEVICMDYDLMKSLLVNLIDNASKASEPGQSIRISASGNEISVMDSGRGIPADEVGRVTDAFYMVDRSRNKRLGGSGLGLALVKRIADAHGAQLRIESSEYGTTVRLLFPDNKTFTT